MSEEREVLDIWSVGNAQRIEFAESKRQPEVAFALGEASTGCVAGKGGKVVDMLWDWKGWVVTAIAAIAAMIAIRGSIRFDINEWLKDRRKRQEETLRSLCPHISVEEQDGDLLIRSAQISPSGTTVWQCQSCGDLTHDKHAIDQGTRYWAENPDALVKRQRRIEKLARKLGRM